MSRRSRRTKPYNSREPLRGILGGLHELSGLGGGKLEALGQETTDSGPFGGVEDIVTGGRFHQERADGDLEIVGFFGGGFIGPAQGSENFV